MWLNTYIYSSSTYTGPFLASGSRDKSIKVVLMLARPTKINGSSFRCGTWVRANVYLLWLATTIGSEVVYQESASWIPTNVFFLGISWHPGGKFLLTASDDKSLRVRKQRQLLFFFTCIAAPQGVGYRSQTLSEKFRCTRALRNLPRFPQVA